MNPIIEKVARALDPDAWLAFDVEGADSNRYWDRRKCSERQARAAIRATLDYLKDNVREGMEMVVLSEALAELDA